MGTKAGLHELVWHYKDRLLREANLERLTALPLERLRRVIGTQVEQMVAEERVMVPLDCIHRLQEMVADEVTGHGPLEPLLHDGAVSEIMVNGPAEVYVEREGRIELSEVAFKDAEHIRHIIDRMVARIGRRIDESSPMVDARLPDGSRINAVIAPVSLQGPVLTIRKFHSGSLTLEDFVCGGAMAPAMAEFLTAAVRARLNTVISGGTGSGKTTLLAALAARVPAGERVVTIEDMAELRLPLRHVIGLEARPANVEGRGEITIRQLVRNALRMRPDRIIVGEVRGEEALDMLQAMNTGHEGGLTTVHANSPQDAFCRLEAMVIMSGTRLPVPVIRNHLANALHLIIQTERLADGRRKVVKIAEVTGGGTGGVTSRDLFWFERTGISPDGQILGRFRGCGQSPDCWRRLQAAGVAPPPELFTLPEE